MKLIVQETNGAYAGDIPESAWQTVSVRRKLSTAREAKDSLVTAMKRRCAPGAWDSHQRIVNAGVLPVKWTVAWYCTGWRGNGSNMCRNWTDVAYAWSPGESEPREHAPKGWSGTQCPSCQSKQAEFYA